VIPLAYSDERHQRAHQFLVEEAALLDDHQFEAWFALTTDDIRYRMPVRVTTMVSAGGDTLTDMAHFDDDRHSLSKRVARLQTEHAWTEDPPSRTQHLVTNVRTFTTDTPTELRVDSALLLFRSRGDDRPPEWLCARREDGLRQIDDGGLRLFSRRILVAESVLRTQNLAIFL
jgi:phthalate 3,4-dioxygenase subunit beta